MPDRTRRKTPSHKCPTCSRTFCRMEHLRRHNVSAHESARHFSCTVCHKAFSRKDELQRHYRIHTRDGEMTPPHREAATRYMRMYNDAPVVQNKNKTSKKNDAMDAARSRASINNINNAFHDESPQSSSTSSSSSRDSPNVLSCANAGVLSRGLTACQNSRKMQIHFLIDE
ncbi:hypothetical protein BJ741DRAFT_365773 [Chytriomyces cf. hyalinus JEL632]|nr:hypothetical protein BJ741DRAFT_365773 [Chytriomyces cf. hyalinus JEL632]